jgi:hypothetical protein
MKRFIIILGLLMASSFVMAGNSNPGGLEPVPEPPELPDPVASGESIEPEVTIIRKDDAVIEEYRVNGQLYMVKITPVVGPAYYLKDMDGNGKLDPTHYELKDPEVPEWVLFTW